MSMFESSDGVKMAERIKEITHLLHKHLKGELSHDEQNRLDAWANESEQNRQVLLKISDEGTLTDQLKTYYELLPKIEQGKNRHLAEATKVIDMFSRKTLWHWYTAAASILLVFAIGSYVYYKSEKRHQAAIVSTTIPTNSIIPPAGNKAILTLSSGLRVELDSAVIGTIAQDGNTTINKKQDGQIVYHSFKVDSSRLAYNLVSTPKGGTFQVILPDNSHVWLNAGSSLRFPIAFTGANRVVELTGEAYFQVVPQSLKDGLNKKPFIVRIKGPSGEAGEVEVLGTHFNINGYQDEQKIRATLLEGSVRITQHLNPQKNILKPGQQAILNTGSNTVSIESKQNPQSAIAWLNGKFNFESVSFHAMMQELSRWYDVEIAYEGRVPESSVVGVVDRTMPLATLLYQIEKMGDWKLRLEGKKVTVTR